MKGVEEGYWGLEEVGVGEIGKVRKGLGGCVGESLVGLLVWFG